MDFEIEYNEDKSRLLKATRGVCFDDVIELIKKDQIVADINHFNQKKYHKQAILIIKFKDYYYMIPHIKDLKNKVMFLKTIYPSRKYKKKYEKKL